MGAQFLFGCRASNISAHMVPMTSTLESSWVIQRVRLPRPLHCTPLPTVHFSVCLSEIYTKASLHVPPCRVDAFGIDGNVFASDYKAPKDNIHIAVAQIHCANSDCSDDGKSKVKGAVSSMEAAAGEVVKDISKLALPDNEAAMSAKRVQLKQAAQKAQLTQLTYGQSDESNVYDPEHYSRPLEGHWVDVGSKGFKHWATGSEMVSKYGTDDPTKLKGKGHTAYQEAKSPSLYAPTTSFLQFLLFDNHIFPPPLSLQRNRVRGDRVSQFLTVLVCVCWDISGCRPLVSIATSLPATTKSHRHGQATITLVLPWYGYSTPFSQTPGTLCFLQICSIVNYDGVASRFV